MYTRLVLQMFVDIFAFNEKLSAFTAFVDADIGLEVDLLHSETHILTVVLVHVH
jgi:hypothetical protein